MTNARKYAVLCAQVIGDTRGVETVYNFDGEYFTDRDAAISHGFTIRESDDFNIGVVEGGKLVSLDWMHEDIGEDSAELVRIAEGMGLS